MHPRSPWAVWHPTQLGSLKRKLDAGSTPSLEDLAVTIEHNPDAVPDALLRELLLKALRGKLSKPRGRPRSALSRMQCQAAAIWIEQSAEWVREEIETGELKWTRGDPGPAEIAADRVGRMFSLAGLNLRNQISAIKKREVNLKA